MSQIARMLLICARQSSAYILVNRATPPTFLGRTIRRLIAAVRKKASDSIIGPLDHRTSIVSTARRAANRLPIGTVMG